MINRRSDRPIRLQLADLLREQIRAGSLRAGDELPSEKTLAQEHEVGRDTVRAAIAILRAEGLVTTRRPYATVVREPQDRETIKLQRGSRLTVRMPSPEERDEMDLDDGVPVVEVRYGGRTRLYGADRCDFTSS